MGDVPEDKLDRNEIELSLWEWVCALSFQRKNFSYQRILIYWLQYMVDASDPSQDVSAVQVPH